MQKGPTTSTLKGGRLLHQGKENITGMETTVREEDVFLLYILKALQNFLELFSS